MLTRLHYFLKATTFSLALVLLTQQFTMAATVQQPVFVKQIKWTGTAWFGSPIVHTLGSGSRKIIGTFYDINVWDGQGNELDEAPHGSNYPHKSRIYAPAVVADLENDGVFEIVAASGDRVVAYEWRNESLQLKAGWPATTCSAGQCPETRGLAAGDLDNNGSIEIVATTTQTGSDGAQVFVFSADGSSYQPPGLPFTAWPRYNNENGYGNDGDVNGPGNNGYGCYGLNVAIGNVDDDQELEIVVTYDNHHINVFEHTGISKLTAPYFTNRHSEYRDNRLNWGQFIRYFDAEVEYQHYHLHEGDWPGPVTKKWLQWTSSPPGVADINGDGKNEVLGVANVEMDEPYDTKHHSIMVLQGDYGEGDESGMRLSGWESLPSSGYPLARGSRSWYPPRNPPAPTIADILGDKKPEIIYAAHDGYIYCTSATAQHLWRYDFRHNRDLMYASEVSVADLNQDNIPELIFTTYGDPDNIAPNVPHGYLVILDINGNRLHDIELYQQGTNGNGKGAPAAPTIMDVDGNGTLEILIQTFGAGFFIYTVPGSAENLLPWPTARGNFLRNGASVDSSGSTKAIFPAIYLLLKDELH